MTPLTDVEIRILGSLLEKEVTTPENYPLSLNALLAACNQTTNREPVMRLTEDDAIPHIVSLRRGGLVRQIQPVGSRVTKYEHLLDVEWKLDAPALAVLGVLMLRGPQTPGELHSRTARLAAFADLAEMEAVLDALITREPEPLVARLPRRPGQKEVRYTHLLTGEAPPADAFAPEPRRGEGTLEQAVAELREEVAALRAELAELRARFG